MHITLKHFGIIPIGGSTFSEVKVVVKQYCKVPSELIIRFGNRFPCDVYLKLSDSKIIKLSRKDNVVDVVRKYQAKGISEVYTSRVEFSQFMDLVQKGIHKEKLLNPNVQKNHAVLIKQLNDARKLVQESLIHFGATKTAINLAREISDSSFKVMQSAPKIFGLFKKLAGSCEKEFLRTLLTGYTGCCILDYLSWQSRRIKEKIFLASFLCELTLDMSELENLAIWECGDFDKSILSQNILEHSDKILQLLRKTTRHGISQDVLTIIEQHHERPDKSGFPGGLGAEKVMPLACVYIVARNFSILIEKNEFKESRRVEILQQIRKRFNRGNYKKAVFGLDKMFAA